MPADIKVEQRIWNPSNGGVTVLKVQVTVEGEDKILSMDGELDIATVDKFKDSVDEARQGVKRMVLDLAGLGFVDSTGVGGLLNVIKSLKKDNVEVKVRNVSTEVYDVFDLLGLPILLGKEIFS